MKTLISTLLLAPFFLGNGSAFAAQDGPNEGGGNLGLNPLQDVETFHAKETYRELTELIRDYLEANGGRSYVESINSVRMIGSFTEGDNKLEMTTFRKRPNLVRTNFQAEQYKLSLGFDGYAAWQSLERSGMVTSGQMGGTDAEDFKRHSYFLHPFFTVRETGKSLTFVGKEKYNNRDCWRVDYKDGDVLVKIYHSCDNLFELGSLSVVKINDKECLLDIRKEEHKLVERLFIPHRITTFRDGKVTGVYQFTNISLNHGLQDSYFRKPTPRFNR